MNFARVAACTLFSALAVGAAYGVQAQIARTKPPLDDKRLTVHTLLREDIFAGFLENDLKRFARGEKNIDALLKTRPEEKANLLAWKGGALLYRAVLDHESRRDDRYRSKYKQAVDLLAQAGAYKTGNGGVDAITGGSFLLFADRLPEADRAAAWNQSYNAYQAMWKQQASVLDKFPLHHRGEVLGGLAMSAERTGRHEESEQVIAKMRTMLAGSPYETAIAPWKANPKKASQIACLTCHESGRLADRLATLDKSPK